MLVPVSETIPAGWFRDHRDRYFLFVSISNEKKETAARVIREFEKLRTGLSAVRLLDVGVGDGTVLTTVLKGMEDDCKDLPFYVVAKEISGIDVEKTLEKMAARFAAHRRTVLTLTNLENKDAVALRWADPEKTRNILWHPVTLRGDSEREFGEQLAGLKPFIEENWKTRIGPKTGRLLYEKPLVLTIRREDQDLADMTPWPGAARADYDLVIASQPFRARSEPEEKARLMTPLALGLARGGRLVGIHAEGDDPAYNVAKSLWPDVDFFPHDSQQVLAAIKQALPEDSRRNYSFIPDARHLSYALRRFDENDGKSILAAWNAATYVAQVEDKRLEQALADKSYETAIRNEIRRSGRDWSFNNGVWVVARAPGLIAG